MEFLFSSTSRGLNVCFVHGTNLFPLQAGKHGCKDAGFKLYYFILKKKQKEKLCKCFIRKETDGVVLLDP